MGEGVGGRAVGAWVFGQGDEVGDGAMANKRTCGFVVMILEPS